MQKDNHCEFVPAWPEKHGTEVRIVFDRESENVDYSPYQQTLFDIDEFFVNQQQDNLKSNTLCSDYDNYKKLDRVLANCIDICKRANIQTGCVTAIKINKHLKRSWGLCRLIQGGSFTIEINEKLLSKNCPEHSLETVILHELCHTVEGCWDHRKNWKETARKLEPYGYHITTTTSDKELGLS